MMSLLEEFVVRVYSSKLEGVTTVNRARYEMFTYGGKDFDHLPPTKNALSFHTLRALTSLGTYGDRHWIHLPIYLLHRPGDMK